MRIIGNQVFSTALSALCLIGLFVLIFIGYTQPEFRSICVGGIFASALAAAALGYVSYHYEEPIKYFDINKHRKEK